MSFKKIKIGCVGLGRLGSIHAKNIAHKIPQAELYAVCSRTMEKAVAIKNELNAKHAYDDYNQMIENENLDAICITSYTKFHPEQILKALEKKMDVFCDKPIASTFEEADKIAKKINKNHSDKICMIGYMKRYDPSYIYVKGEIDKGKLGNPILFRSYAADFRKISDMSEKYLKKESDGIFYDFFVHDFDISRWFIGSDWKPSSVNTLGGTFVYDSLKSVKDADNAVCMAQFKNNAMAFYYCSRTAPHGYLIETEIIGTERIFRIGTSASKNLVEVFDNRGRIKEDPVAFYDRFDVAYLNEMQEFVSCIIEKRKPKNTIQDAVLSSKMALYATKNFKGESINN